MSSYQRSLSWFIYRTTWVTKYSTSLDCQIIMMYTSKILRIITIGKTHNNHNHIGLRFRLIGGQGAQISTLIVLIAKKVTELLHLLTMSMMVVEIKVLLDKWSKTVARRLGHSTMKHFRHWINHNTINILTILNSKAFKFEKKLSRLFKKQNLLLKKFHRLFQLKKKWLRWKIIQLFLSRKLIMMENSFQVIHLNSIQNMVVNFRQYEELFKWDLQSKAWMKKLKIRIHFLLVMNLHENKLLQTNVHQLMMKI